MGTVSDARLKSRFEGCLFGLAVGDALGAKFEGHQAVHIRERFPTIEQLIGYPDEEIWYTDDTQMAIALCEALIKDGQVVEETLCRAFASNYVSTRGYGRGARAIIEAMLEGRDHRTVAEGYFPGGSYGNGAAMRVAPIGLLFRHDHQRLWEQARLSSLPTHLHPLGIEGAQLLALAVALCTDYEQFDRANFLALLNDACESDEYRDKLKRAAQVESVDDLASLGNGIESLHSVPTAIASFAFTPESYEETIGNVIFLGGDTDTMAAMAGAMSGAFLGIERLPARLVDLLETSPKGGEYIRQLAGQLYEQTADFPLREAWRRQYDRVLSPFAV